MVSISLVWVSIATLILPVSVPVHALQTSFPQVAVPLVIRSPHFSIWYNGPEPFSNSWPQTWNGAKISWGGKIRVDGLTYSWMGQYDAHNETANVTDIEITPTRSIFVVQAGPMNVTVTFLNPIQPLAGWVNQSIPFSYMSVEAQSLDGAAHSIQLYTGIASEFVTGIAPQGEKDGGLVRWDNFRIAMTLYHETEPEVLQPFAEVSEQAMDGRGYLATTLRSSGLTWAIIQDTRTPFTQYGSLSDTKDLTFGPLGMPYDTLAFAVDLGTITSTSTPVTWAIGYVRDPVVQYTTSSGTTELRRPYWTTRYSDINSLANVLVIWTFVSHHQSEIQIDAFLADYPDALLRAISFDEKPLLLPGSSRRGPATDIVSRRPGAGA